MAPYSHPYSINNTHPLDYYSHYPTPPKHSRPSHATTTNSNSRSGPVRDSGASQYLIPNPHNSGAGSTPLMQPVPHKAKRQPSYHDLRATVKFDGDYSITRATNQKTYDSGQHFAQPSFAQKSRSEIEISYYGPSSEIMQPEMLRPWEGIDPAMQANLHFFQLDEVVLVRGWLRSQNRYSRWVVGRVKCPIMKVNREGKEERRYVVSYKYDYSDPDPTKGFKDEEFVPTMDEIRSLPSAPPGNTHYVTTTGGVSTKYDVADPIDTVKILPSGFLFAGVLERNTDGDLEEVWAPAMCIEKIRGPNTGCAVKILGGMRKDAQYVVYRVKRYVG